MAALQKAMQAQGADWYSLVTERCPHLFAAAPVFIAAAHMQQMREVIDAAERVIGLPGWQQNLLPSPACGRGAGREGGAYPLPSPLPCTGEGTDAAPLANDKTLGVFYCYDFHLNADGAHLIEINSNAGGGFLMALLLDSQREADWPGTTPVPASAGSGTAENLEEVFLEMFRNEWQLACADAPLQSIAIVDEQPEEQYLYPEFLLAQKMFQRAGIATFIADPSALQLRGSELYFDETRIDLVYNRLTDFSLQRYPALRQAYLEGGIIVTPSPKHYERYADKRNLARLTDAAVLHERGATETDIATLLNGIPRTIAVKANMEETLWSERRQWFFKPNTGYGSKGAYRGEKLTKRVFAEILQSEYVAQKLAPPGERSVCVDDAEAALLKYDVRCFVYNGQVQLLAARLYQGQTTNFRTPGGGFAPVRVVE